MRKKITYIPLALLILLAGCSKSYFSINDNNPNQITKLPAQGAMAGVLNQTAAIVTCDFPFLACSHGYWTVAQGFSDIIDFCNFNYSTNFGQSIWQDIYGNLGNISYIENSAQTDSSLVFFGAFAKILKAQQYQMLVDVYNNVPYTQASIVADLYPKYDNAQAIYEDIIKKIDTAIQILNISHPTAVQPTTATDIMFGGNVTLWKQFANTLKLRILLHQSEMAGRQSYIQTQIQNIVNEGDGFLQAGQNAWVNPGYTRNNLQQNPFYVAFGYNSSGGQSPNNVSFRAQSYAISFYTNTNDSRIGYFYSTLGNTNQYVGGPWGTQGLPAPSSASGIGPGLLQNDGQSCPIMTAMESLFLQAEAAQRGWIVPATTTQDLYQQAIRESYRYLNVTNADIAAAAYYNQAITNVGWAASSDKIQAIMVQKWAAMNGIDWPEVWTDYRRLHLPSDIPFSNSPNVAGPHNPVRLLYPTIEYQTNQANVQAMGTINQFTSKIFWMP
jgi:SusD/RagB-like outer membrane lipoprotein